MRMTANQYSRTLYMWNGVSAIFMYGCITPPHSHNTVQIVFDLRNAFKCKVSDTDWQLYKTVVIRENAIHQLDPNGCVQLLLYADAESNVSKKIKSKYLKGCDISSLDLNILDYVKPGELEKCLIEPNAALLENIVFRLLQVITNGENKFVTDERIKEVIRLLQKNNSAVFTISLLAKEIHLSESRLRFLFKKIMGVPLHRFIIWNRIMLALTKIMNGETVENAALETGFTDTSHFHKLLLQMFGVSPSQFIKSSSQRQLQILSLKKMKMETRFYNEKNETVKAIHAI